jgi:hypothetical protein
MMGILGFFFGRPRLSLGLLAVLAVAGLWMMFRGLQAENARLDQALEHAHQMRAAAENRLALETMANDEAERTHSVNAITRTIEREIEREMTDAVQRQDAHALYVAWVGGVRRLRDDAGAGIGA